MKVMLLKLPSEGEPRDYITPTYFNIGTVKNIPHGLLAVASGIKKHHEVVIFDAESKDFTINQTIEEIDKRKPDVLGMTASIGTAHSMGKILRKVKCPKKVVGGPHATHYAKEILELGAHAVFVHDGDINFGEWLDNGCEPGIYTDYIKDLDSLPMPALEYLNLDDYAIKPEKSNEVLLKNKGLRFSMYSSKGCPFRCVFCDIQDKKFRLKSAKRIVDEIEMYLAINSKTIHMMDDCFNVKKSHVLGICEEINKRGLKFEWSARGRASIDYQTAVALKEAGCIRLHVGVETFDPIMLKYINKNLTIEEIENFFKICREVGMETLAYFIAGFPGETKEYRKKLPQLIRDMGIDLPFFNVLFPFPHSEIYINFLKDGTFKTDFWKEYALNPVPYFEPPLYHPKELHEEILETVEGYVREFYPDSN